MDMNPAVRALLDASPTLPNDQIFYDILYHNAGVESSQQMAVIAELLDQRERHLRSLADAERRFDEAMGLIREEIIKMDAQCDVLRKAIASPIRALPVDVLHAIFSLCGQLPSPYLPFRYSVEAHTHHPLRLTHICRWWRRIVHDMPTLWQRLFLTYRSIMHPKARSYIEQWPLHSSDLPLSYTIDVDVVGYSSQESALCSRGVSQFMGDVHQFPSHRLRSLDIKIRARYLVPALSNLSLRAFPRLEDLKLDLLKERSEDHSRIQPLTSPIHAFEDATLLSALDLYSVIDNTLLDHLRIPWSSLTNLALYLEGSSSVIIAILQLCPRLVDLDINERDLDLLSNIRRGMIRTTPAVQVILGDLRSLSFEDTSACLASIMAPDLSSAELHGIDWRHAKPVLVAFLQRTSNITSLTLVNCDFISYEGECLPMTPLWQLLPRVETLVLEDCELSVLMLVDDLTIPPGDTPVLPCLQDLRITELRGYAPYDPEVMADRFAGMVESRMRPRPGISPIRRVELWPRTKEAFPLDFIPRVRNILGDGVELVLPLSVGEQRAGFLASMPASAQSSRAATPF